MHTVKLEYKRGNHKLHTPDRVFLEYDSIFASYNFLYRTTFRHKVLEVGKGGSIRGPRRRVIDRAPANAINVGGTITDIAEYNEIAHYRNVLCFDPCREIG